MKVDVTYIGTRWFPIEKIGWWVFYFKKYTYIKGFQIRIFGFHFNIRENNGTEKIIQNYTKIAPIA